MNQRPPINIRVGKDSTGYYIVHPHDGHHRHDPCDTKQAAMEKARLLALSFGDHARVLDLTGEA